MRVSLWQETRFLFCPLIINLFFSAVLCEKEAIVLMDFEVVTVVEPELVRLTATGSYSLEGVSDLLDHVKAEADKAARELVLIDTREVEGNMTEADRFFAGRRLAEAFGSRLKTAVLLPAYKITKLGEAVAVSRGARVLVTDSETEALNWLLTE